MKKAPRNKTLTLSNTERRRYRRHYRTPQKKLSVLECTNAVINADLFRIMPLLPERFVDLLIIDPPYNLTKLFNKRRFKKMTSNRYEDWVDSWLSGLLRILKPTASIYICGDWRSSAALHRVCEKYFIVRNRITFEREKGRGAKNNWKNNSEDIWFCTLTDDYTFNADAVKLKRKVIAPYRNNGTPKDWTVEKNGSFRLTYPSNIWTDITIPFWSMHENTPHPTQKPEKLMAKIILASSHNGDMVFDPFSGAGTTGVAAQKLNRRFCMIDIDADYCCYALKRLAAARKDQSIQGYNDGIFKDRNCQ